MANLLQIKNLSVTFNSGVLSTHAVKNISFNVGHGEIVAIVGESGSGKSVTALTILQLLPENAETSGEILFSGDQQEIINLLDTKSYQPEKIRGEKIAMIFQEPMTSLNPVFTCGYQVSEVLKLHRKLTASEAKKQTLEWFSKVKLPDPPLLYNRYPHQLSGGQKQRVMIAMAMCCQPSLLICDEPTTALDVTVQKTILELIKELQSGQQFGVLFITHDLGVVAEMAHRVLVMYKGEIAEQGNAKEIFSTPQHPYTKGLLACRPILHQKGERLPVVGDFLNEEISPHEQIAGKIDHSLSQPVENRILVRAESLSVHFPSRRNFFGKPVSFIKAVDDVSFEIMEGETMGLVGESGSGKTTLGRALLMLQKPDSGHIYYQGTDLTRLSHEEIKPLRKSIQIIFQDPYSSLNPRMKIGQALAEPLKIHGLYKKESQRLDRVAELLEKVNLSSAHMSRYPHEFSGGQRQRIVIARALALDPSFIVCDESVSALDVSIQAQVLNLLNDIKKEFGLTLLFISHDLSVVKYLSDRIMVMFKGKILETGNAEDIYKNPRQEYTKTLIDSIPKGA